MEANNNNKALVLPKRVVLDRFMRLGLLAMDKDMGANGRRVLKFEEEDDRIGDELKVNKVYARRFNEKNKRDDLFRAKELGLLDDDSEEEDERGAALTPALDLDIFKTISMIRTKDERIYDPNFKPFQSSSDSEADSRDDDDDEPETSKPFTYKDMVREAALDGKAVSEDEDENQESKPYSENQTSLKKAFKEAANGSLDEEADDDEDGLLELKRKTREELDEEEGEFRKYLEELKRDKKLEKKVKDLGLLEKVFSEPTEDEGEKFLRSYVLNKGWISKYDIDDDDEVEGDESLIEKKRREIEEQDAQDLEAVEKAEEFESKYNFRFEEPGSDMIQGYARQIEDSVRRTENSRKRQREAKKKRKEEEKLKRIEELKRLKNLKRQELEARIAKVTKVAGIREGRSVITVDDLDTDFDPIEWDKKMARMFNDDYYNEEDDDVEAIKPSFSEEESGGEDDVGTGSGQSKETEDKPQKSGGKKKKKKKRRGEKSSEDLMEMGVDESEMNDLSDDENEVLRLDYEGIAGGLKTRFKYRKVPASSYGLSSEEILLADDKLLNSFISLKRIAPYRDNEWKASTKHRKRFRQRLRESLETKSQKKAKKRRRMLEQANGKPSVEVDQVSESDEAAQETKLAKRVPDQPEKDENEDGGEAKTAAGKRKRKRKRSKKKNQV